MLIHLRVVNGHCCPKLQSLESLFCFNMIYVPKTHHAMQACAIKSTGHRGKMALEATLGNSVSDT